MKKGKCINALVLIIAMVFSCLIVAQGSIAATYPDHTIKLIVPFSAGGPASTISVMVAKRASEFLEHPITVEHKPGGSGTLAGTFVATSKPDGYTLMTGSDSPLLLQPLITADVTYTLESFIPIIGFGVSPININVQKGRWNALKDLIADAKKSPGKLTYSTAGVNSHSHLTMKMLSDMAGIDLKMVPYPGTAETNAALLGGHIDISCVGGTGGMYRAGRLDILAVAEKKRLPDLPNAPTLNELGYPIFLNANYFLCAPKGTPKEILDKLSVAHKKAFAKYGDEISALLSKFEMHPAFATAEELVAENNTRRDMFRKVTKSMGILVPNR